MSSKKKKRGKKSEKRGEERKRKVKVKTAVSLKRDLEILLSAHARTSQANIIVCIWIRTPQSVRPVNGFLVNCSLTVGSDEKTA